MKKLIYQIDQKFWNDHRQRLIFIHEIHDFLTLFNSPTIDVSVFDRQIGDIYKSSKGNFSLIISKEGEQDLLKLFQSGEPIFSLLLKNSLEAKVELSERFSDTVKNEINSRFLDLQKRYPVIEQKSNTAALRKNSETQKFEISFFLEKISSVEFSKKFMAPFNKICRLLSSNRSPEFTHDDLVYEIRTSGYEEFYRLSKTSDVYDVHFEEYIFDTGHYAHPKNGHVSFSFSEKNCVLLSGNIQGGWIRIDVQTDESIAEKIKTILIEELS